MHTLTYSGPFAQELTTALNTIQVASAEVRSIYESQSAETYIKGDGSPVTDADLASDRIIRQHLSQEFPDDALLTEEGVKDTARLRNRRCWIADPIDGTPSMSHVPGCSTSSSHSSKIIGQWWQWQRSP